MFAVGCQAKSPQQPELLFNENSVGRIKLGQSREEALALLDKRKWRESDWVPEGEVIGTVIEVYEGEEILFSAEIYKGTVYRLNVMSPRVRTMGNLGVGSTLGQVKKQLGNPPRLLTGEDGLFAVFNFPEGAMSFGLDVPEPIERYATDDAKVRFVLITAPKRS